MKGQPTYCISGAKGQALRPNWPEWPSPPSIMFLFSFSSLFDPNGYGCCEIREHGLRRPRDKEFHRVFQLVGGAGRCSKVKGLGKK